MISGSLECPPELYGLACDFVYAPDLEHSGNGGGGGYGESRINNGPISGLGFPANSQLVYTWEAPTHFQNIFSPTPWPQYSYETADPLDGLSHALPTQLDLFLPLIDQTTYSPMGLGSQTALDSLPCSVATADASTQHGLPALGAMQIDFSILDLPATATQPDFNQLFDFNTPLLDPNFSPGPWAEILDQAGTKSADSRVSLSLSNSASTDVSHATPSTSAPSMESSPSVNSSHQQHSPATRTAARSRKREPRKRYPCGCGCGKVYCHPQDVGRHQKKEILECPHCRKKFKGGRKDNLNRHINKPCHSKNGRLSE